MSIKAGNLDQRLLLESKVNTSDALNGQTVEWVPQGGAWAERLRVTGRYAHLADQMQELTDVVFRIRRHVLPVSGLWRVIWTDENKTMTITNVLDDDEPGGQLLICSEGQRDA